MLKSLKMLGLGAGAMYFLDPERGRCRRARVYDQFVHLGHELEDALDTAASDMRNRACGLMAEAEGWIGTEHASDAVVAERVRARIGRFTSHPRAIEVHARDGTVTLAGPVLAAEVEGLIKAASSVRGVNRVVNWLEVHQNAASHPALQGGRPRAGELPEIWQQTWSPSMRLIAGATGTVLALQLLRKRTLAGLALGAVGTAVAARWLGDEGSRQRTRRRSRRPRAGERAMTGAPSGDVAAPRSRAPVLQPPGSGI